VLLLLAGCAEPAAQMPSTPALPAPYQCVLPSEQRMLIAELFFGRNIKGGGFVTDVEWTKFAAEIVTPNFPDGFTAFDANGQWRNPQTDAIARDPTKVLIVAVQRSPNLAGRLQAVIDAYKTRYRQQSVGIVTRDSCASFE
jgi:hypothetical protein